MDSSRHRYSYIDKVQPFCASGYNKVIAGEPRVERRERQGLNSPAGFVFSAFH